MFTIQQDSNTTGWQYNMFTLQQQDVNTTTRGNTFGEDTTVSMVRIGTQAHVASHR